MAAGGGTIEARILKSLKEASPREWDSIVRRDNIISSYGYLRAIEESNINDCSYRYIMLYEGGALKAHTCIYSMSFDLDIFNEGFSKRLIAQVRRVIPGFLTMRLVECGTPTALGNTISFSPDAEKPAAIALIVKAMEEFAREEGIGMLVLRDFVEGELPLFDVLKSFGFRRMNNLPDTFIDVSWEDFDEYLSNLRSHFRNEVIKNRRKLKEAGLEVEDCVHFAPHARDLLRLWMNVYNRADEYKREVLTEEYFRGMDHYLGDRSHVLLIRKGEEIVGFGLVLEDEETLRFMYTGIDYDCNREHSVYFNTIYNVIECALRLGKRRIETGISDYFPKLSVGAEVEPLHIYMKHRNPLLSFLVLNLFRILTPPKDIHPRRVFKSRRRA